jgi:MFS family permease
MKKNEYINKALIPIYLINFLLAISTTIGMTILPLLATTKLGLSLFTLGLIEGGTEFISSFLRLTTGSLFDNIKNKKNLFLFPIILALLGKIMLLIPNGVTISLSKIFERMSNGAFASPRDAYIGVNSKNKGIGIATINITKALGCVIGPVIISIITIIGIEISNNLHYIVSFSCFLCLLSILIVYFMKSKSDFQIKPERLSFKKIKDSFRQLKAMYFLTFCFFLGRFNDGLIMLFLKSMGYPEWFYVATISIFNSVMFLISPLFGLAIDSKKNKSVIYITIMSLIIFNIIYMNINYISIPVAICGLFFWGVQRSGAQIAFISTIFSNVKKEQFGSSAGLFSCISGAGTLISSIICGSLAELSYQLVFMFSGFFTLASLIVFFISTNRKLITLSS